MSSLPGSKQCSKCGTMKDASEFYVKDAGTGRLHARCKTCHNAICSKGYYADHEENKRKRREYARVVHAANPERIRRRQAEWRAANIDRVREQARQREQGRKAQRAAYRAANAERRKAYNAEYRKKNAAKVKASNDLYRQRLGDLLTERQRQWREANPERYAAIHAAWKKRNVEAMRAAGHRRRCREQDNGGSYTPEEWEALKAFYDYHCLRCGRREPEITLHVDHIRPVSKGGSNDIDNIQPLCRSCNSCKHTRRIDYRRGWVNPKGA